MKDRPGRDGGLVLSLTIIRKVVFTQIRDEQGCISRIAGGTSRR